MLAEATVLPVVHWARGYRTWISLGNVPPAIWPGRSVTLVQSLYVYTAEHDDQLRGGDRWIARVQRLQLRGLARFEDGLLFPSASAARDAARMIGPVPTRVCHWGIGSDLPRVAPASVTPMRSRLRLGCMSTLYRHKSIERVLTGLRALVDRGIDAELVVIGGAPDPTYASALQQQVERAELGDRVRFTGALDHGSALDLLVSCDVYVLLSTIETFGMSWLEAQAIGLPVVAPDVPIARESLGDVGVFVAQDDAGAVADGILDAVERADELRSASESNIERHAVAATAAAFYRACEELLEGRSHARR